MGATPSKNTKNSIDIQNSIQSSINNEISNTIKSPDPASLPRRMQRQYGRGCELQGISTVT